MVPPIARSGRVYICQHALKWHNDTNHELESAALHCKNAALTSVTNICHQAWIFALIWTIIKLNINHFEKKMPFYFPLGYDDIPENYITDEMLESILKIDELTHRDY